jgi:hypothetical protein
MYFDEENKQEREIRAQYVRDNFPALSENEYRRPPYYIGATYEDTFKVYEWWHPSGSLLDEANFTAIEAMEIPGVFSTQTGGAFGRFDTLRYDPLDDTEDYTGARKLEDLLCALSEYPVVCDETYSEMEYDRVYGLWGGRTLPRPDRILPRIGGVDFRRAPG